jgi:hypothetical protein
VSTPRKELTGQKFDRLTVIAPAGSDKNRNHLWECRCDCGKSHLANSSVLLKHGLSESPEYIAFHNAIKRCEATSKNKADYFSRGIHVCKQWKAKRMGFKSFITHIGRRPSPQHSLDRIDNDKGYEPGNVRWATAKEQAANRRVKRIEHFTDEALLAECAKRGLIKESSILSFKGVAVSENTLAVGSVCSWPH